MTSIMTSQIPHNDLDCGVCGHNKCTASHKTARWFNYHFDTSREESGWGNLGKMGHQHWRIIIRWSRQWATPCYSYRCGAETCMCVWVCVCVCVCVSESVYICDGWVWVYRCVLYGLRVKVYGCVSGYSSGFMNVCLWVYLLVNLCVCACVCVWLCAVFGCT